MRALGDATGPEVGAARARLQARYAVRRLSQGRYGDAVDGRSEPSPKLEAADQLDAQAEAHLVLDAVEVWSGGPKGEQHAETALRIFEQLGDRQGRPTHSTTWPYGHWLKAAGPMRYHVRPGGRVFRRVGDASNAANADYNRADVLVRQGRSDEALPLLQNTLRVARAVGDEELVALVLKEQGRARSRSGDVQTGLLLLQEARAQLAKLREPQEVVDADMRLPSALVGGFA